MRVDDITANSKLKNTTKFTKGARRTTKKEREMNAKTLKRGGANAKNKCSHERANEFNCEIEATSRREDSNNGRFIAPNFAF